MANLIDITDPVDIIMMADPEIAEMMDSIEANGGDYESLYNGIKLECSDEYEDEVGDTFDSIDDNSTDMLDVEADERIENLEDDDSDGELIDMIMLGVDINDLEDPGDDITEDEEEEEEDPEEEE